MDFFDGHPLVNWRHENLMRLFFRALRAYVQPGGIVKAGVFDLHVGAAHLYRLHTRLAVWSSNAPVIIH